MVLKTYNILNMRALLSHTVLWGWTGIIWPRFADTVWLWQTKPGKRSPRGVPGSPPSARGWRRGRAPPGSAAAGCLCTARRPADACGTARGHWGPRRSPPRAAPRRGWRKLCQTKDHIWETMNRKVRCYGMRHQNTEAQHTRTQVFTKTKSHLSKEEKKNAILEHMPACFEWTAYLNESFKTLSQGHNQHGVNIYAQDVRLKNIRNTENLEEI